MKVNKESNNLLPQLTSKLDRVHQNIVELVKVYAEYGGDYNRDCAYIEDIEAKAAADKEAKYQAQQQIDTSTRKTSKGFASYTVHGTEEPRTSPRAEAKLLKSSRSKSWL